MELVLYSREACGLCDEMLAQLQPLLLSHQASIRVVDIAGDTELMHRFGLRIPVLLCDGEIICEVNLDHSFVAPSVGRRH